jgi:hypothetical protein
MTRSMQCESGLVSRHNDKDILQMHPAAAGLNGALCARSQESQTSWHTGYLAQSHVWQFRNHHVQCIEAAVPPF